MDNLDRFRIPDAFELPLKLDLNLQSSPKVAYEWITMPRKGMIGPVQGPEFLLD
jgi:hypothetical protein